MLQLNCKGVSKMTEKKITPEKFAQRSKGNRVLKSLSEESKTILADVGQRNLGSIVELDVEQSKKVIAGFKTSCKPSGYSSNLCFAIARFLTNQFGFEKIVVGKSKELQENKARVRHNRESNTIELDLRKDSEL